MHKPHPSFELVPKMLIFRSILRQFLKRISPQHTVFKIYGSYLYSLSSISQQIRFNLAQFITQTHGTRDAFSQLMNLTPKLKLRLSLEK